MCLLAVPLLAKSCISLRDHHAFHRDHFGIGSYSRTTRMFDVFITITFGFIGYWLRKMKYPLAPLVVAIVLGDSTERELRKALIASGGSPAIFVASPLAATLMILAIILLVLPLIRSYRERRRAAATAP